MLEGKKTKNEPTKSILAGPKGFLGQRIHHLSNGVDKRRAEATKTKRATAMPPLTANEHFVQIINVHVQYMYKLGISTTVMSFMTASIFSAMDEWV